MGMMGLGRLLALAALLGGLGGCRGQATPPPLQLGHVATLSGPGKAAGEQAMLGIRLAVAEHNQDLDQGIGCPLEVRHTDAHGKLEAFEAEAVRLVSVSKVTALLGGSTVAEAARLERARAPLLTPLGLRSRGFSEQVFCTGLPPSFVGKILARYALQERQQTQATLLVDEQGEECAAAAAAFAKEFAALVNDQAQKNALPFLTTVPLAKEVNWKELAQNLAKGPGGCVLVAAPASALPELLRAWPGPLPLLLWAGPDGALSAAALGQVKGKITFATAFVADAEVPRAREFVKHFRAAFSQEPDVHAALAYDGLRLLIAGLRRLQQPFPPEKLPDELAKVVDFAGLTGTVSFGHDRRLRRPAFVAQLADGRVRALKRYDAEQEEK